MSGFIKPRLTVFNPARIFILINAAIWLVFSGISSAGIHPAYGGNQAPRGGFAIPTALIGGGLTTLVILLDRRSHLVDYLTLAGLTALALVNLFDQMGPIDIAMLAAALIPLVLLLLSREWYLQNEGIQSTGKVLTRDK